jgi:hypothetical protein
MDGTIWTPAILTNRGAHDILNTAMKFGGYCPALINPSELQDDGLSQNVNQYIESIPEAQNHLDAMGNETHSSPNVLAN